MPARKKTPTGSGRQLRRGRPPTLEDPVRFILTIERREIDALRKIARRQGQTIASVVRKAISAYRKSQRRK
jgi:hypothetical protein